MAQPVTLTEAGDVTIIEKDGVKIQIVDNAATATKDVIINGQVNVIHTGKPAALRRAPRPSI